MGPAPHALSLSSRPLVDQVKFYSKPMVSLCENMKTLFRSKTGCIQILPHTYLWLKSLPRTHFLIHFLGAEEEAGSAEANPPGENQ